MQNWFNIVRIWNKPFPTKLHNHISRVRLLNAVLYPVFMILIMITLGQDFYSRIGSMRIRQQKAGGGGGRPIWPPPVKFDIYNSKRYDFNGFYPVLMQFFPPIPLNNEFFNSPCLLFFNQVRGLTFFYFVIKLNSITLYKKHVSF